MFSSTAVCPPDELHFNVNNSGYTNAIAQISLRLPKYALGLLGEASSQAQAFEDIADNMYIPYDKTTDYHPEFDGYSYHGCK